MMTTENTKAIRRFATPTNIQAKIASIQGTHIPDTKVCISIVTLKSGYEEVGIANFADLENFDEKTGIELAYSDAIRKLMEKEAYHCAEAYFAEQQASGN